jgi:hypothetical protein
MLDIPRLLDLGNQGRIYEPAGDRSRLHGGLDEPRHHCTDRNPLARIAIQLRELARGLKPRELRVPVKQPALGPLGRDPSATSGAGTLNQYRAPAAEASEPLHGLRLKRRRDGWRQPVHHDWLVLTDDPLPELEDELDEPPEDDVFDEPPEEDVLEEPPEEDVLEAPPEDVLDDEAAALGDDDAVLAVDENFVSVAITPPTPTNSDTASAATHLRILRTRFRRAPRR